MGKRMAAVTGGCPKELLGVGGVPVLSRALSEVKDAEIGTVYVVSRREKEVLNSYVSAIPDPRPELRFQEAPRGLAHAVASAGVQDRPSVLVMGDSFYFPDSPIGRLQDAIVAGAWASIAVRRVPRGQVGLYGIVEFDPETGTILSTVEKPAPEDAPSDWAVSSRYALSARAMQDLRRFVAEWSHPGEMPLTPFFQEALSRGETLTAVQIGDSEKMYDCGDADGYAAAIKEFGA